MTAGQRSDSSSCCAKFVHSGFEYYIFWSSIKEFFGSNSCLPCSRRASPNRAALETCSKVVVVADLVGCFT